MKDSIERLWRSHVIVRRAAEVPQPAGLIESAQSVQKAFCILQWLTWS